MPTHRRATFNIARLATLGLLCAGVAFSPRTEANEPARAKARYERGMKAYNLGRFSEAVRAFEEAYELDPSPTLLFNIAQAHRQQRSYERALFFYRRYLDQAPRAPNRKDVETRIEEMQRELVRERERLEEEATSPAATEAPRPPQQPPGPAAGPEPRPLFPAAPLPPTRPPADRPAEDPRRIGNTGPLDPGGDGPRRGDGTPAPARRFSVGVAAGPVLPSFAGSELDVPVTSVTELSFARSFPAPSVSFDAGLRGSLSPIHYKTIASSGGSMAGTEKTSWLAGLLVEGIARYPGEGPVGGFLSLGAGVIWWTGLGRDNPFTVGGAAASGPVPMPAGRLSLGITWTVMPALRLQLAPALTYIKTTSPGLTGAISSVTRYELGAGLSYLF